MVLGLGHSAHWTLSLQRPGLCSGQVTPAGQQRCKLCCALASVHHDVELPVLEEDQALTSWAWVRCRDRKEGSMSAAHSILDEMELHYRKTKADWSSEDHMHMFSHYL